jgi:hypothetical protein
MPATSPQTEPAPLNAEDVGAAVLRLWASSLAGDDSRPGRRAPAGRRPGQPAR